MTGRAGKALEQNLAGLAGSHRLTRADDRDAVRYVLQATGAAAKDGTIEHVTSG